jgi:serine/threonine-protein kinase RsbT
VPDSTEPVLSRLGEYFPSAIARAVLRATLRRGHLPEDRLDEGALPHFIHALERTLPMYIVDAERRGQCVDKVRSLVPGDGARTPPSPAPRPPRDTPRRTQVARSSPIPFVEAPTEPHGDRSAGGTVRVRSASDVVDACDLVRHVARAVGFNALDQTKIVTAASELARNIMLYAGDGELRVTVLDVPRRGVLIIASDAGRGIPDIERVMSNGYRSRTGMGMGLKGAKRLMDHLEIESRAGVGTTIVAKKHVS